MNNRPSLKTRRTIDRLGIEKCQEAIRLSRLGEGPTAIAAYVGIADKSGRASVALANSAIDAGRELIARGIRFYAVPTE